jgi:glycosyltransferase involved in cell wall biosynthesis
MNQRPLVVITTRLPPEVCGIGTYSWLLHQHWPHDTARVQFLVIDGAARSKTQLPRLSIAEFSADAAKLSRTLEPFASADLFLHYAGRAYHRYGCPSWLPPVLAKWKARFPSGRLLILFHEMPGDFPITSRHYWIDMCNRRVIRKLSALADVIVTNTSDHVAKLQKLSGRADVKLVPVGSNIPVTANLSERRARNEFVIFGLPFGRWQTLQMFDDEIRLWQQSGRLTKLHLIGPGDAKFDRRSDKLIRSWPNPEIAVRHGMLSSLEVSALLSRAQYGLVNVTPENWSKSTAFMAFASHECAVVAKAKSGAAPLRFTFAPDEVGTIDDVDLSGRARALREWYEQNADWSVIAKEISSLLSANITEEART